MDAEIDEVVSTETGDAVQYAYSTLPTPRHFRLLRLRRRRDGGTLSCSLHEFEIDSTFYPAFEAISYRWDDAGHLHSLQITHEDTILGYVQIRRNVFDLLSELRDDDEGIWLWIDSICINQDSVQERSDQVKLMGDIYSHADIVIVWLHSERDEDDRFHRVKSALERTKSFSGQTEGWPHTLGISKREWRDFNALCVLSYWDRKWIIQELLLARSVIIMHGDYTYPMVSLENFCAWLDRDPDLWGHRKGLHESPLVRLALHRYHKRTERAHPQTLHELLLRYRRHHCQEPADHVYALFNLIGDHRVHLPVDYTMTVAQQFQATIEFLRDHDGLPPSQVLPVTDILIFSFRLWDHVDIRDLRARDLVMPHVGSIMITACDRGPVVPLQESECSIRMRTDQFSLAATPEIVLKGKTPWNWLLGNRGNHWEMVTGKGALVQPAHAVNSRVMPYFQLGDTHITGLTSARIRDGDRVWQFPYTRFALVVRKARNGDVMIVGRAALFIEQEHEYRIEKYDMPESDWVTTGMERDIPRTQAIIVSCEDLPGLSTWVLENHHRYTYHRSPAFRWEPDRDAFGWPENWS